jgi:hypothetical protein
MLGDSMSNLSKASRPRTLKQPSDKEGELLRQLEKQDQERKDTKRELDRERLIRVTAGVIDTITSPEFVERMRLAQLELQRGGGMEAAAKLLSLDALRQSGAEIPDDFRLTSRIFEDPANGLRVEYKSEVSSSNVDMQTAWGACAGAGGPLIGCGCSGWQV